jgi:transcriptional regulator with GAF, ATPase, and Fis domain
MNDGRLTVLPDGRLSTLRPVLSARMKEAAEMLGESAFDEFFDSTMRSLLISGLHCAGAHEGTVWLLDHSRTNLVPRFNSGPKAAAFVGSFRQTLRAGMISMVVATEQPICENEVHTNQRQDRTLDHKLGLVTCSMLAVPLYFASEVRGVISAVRLKPADSTEPDPAGFSPEDLRGLQLTASVLSRLIEHELITLSIGMEASW